MPGRPRQTIRGHMKLLLAWRKFTIFLLLFLYTVSKIVQDFKSRFIPDPIRALINLPFGPNKREGFLEKSWKKS
jgi:hypothetical protein